MIRIERQDPLRLLRELPDGWAQTCITGPPPGVTAEDHWEIAGLLAVASELHRVTRPDATLLWDLERRQPLALRRLVVAFGVIGWQLQKSTLASSSGYLLFAKQPRFHWHPPSTPSRGRSRWTTTTRGPRRAWCIPTPGDREMQRLQRILLAATTGRACSACGTPPQRAARRHARPRLAEPCGHIDMRGRCLVIDPFHLPTSPLAAIAVSYGRSYLGIQAPREPHGGRR